MVGARIRAAAVAESSKDKWEVRYRENTAPLFGTHPSEFLRQTAARSDFDAASALFLADGDGRNSRWLGLTGCAVTAVDLADAARVRGCALDDAAGLSVNRLTGDLATWAGLDMRFDAAILIALHSVKTTRQRAVETATRHLKPGGWLVLEGFSTAQAGRRTMGPTNREKLYDLAETLSWIERDCKLVEALEGLVLLDEGHRHDGYADMVRILARRRGPGE